MEGDTNLLVFIFCLERRFWSHPRSTASEQKSPESVSIHDKQVELWAKLKTEKRQKKKNQIHISFCAIHVSSSSADCFHTRRSAVGAALTLPLCASYLASREGNSIFNWCYFRIFASSCDTSPGCWCEWHCWEALLIRRWQIITIICALCACVRVSQWPVCTACHFFNYSSCG